MTIICSKNRTHPQFSGVVRNVGEKKWLQRKKVATKRGGGKRGNLSRYAAQTMYNLCDFFSIYDAKFLASLVLIIQKTQKSFRGFAAEIFTNIVGENIDRNISAKKSSKMQRLKEQT